VQLQTSGRVIEEIRSNSIGEFSFAMETSKAGTFVVTASADGFSPASETTEWPALAQRRLTLVLELEPYRQSMEVNTTMPAYRATLDLGDVRESPAKDLGEALASVDGVTKIRKGGIANDVVVRGFQQNNIQVLVDGTRTYGACPGHMDPPAQHVDFAQVDHVEITKGAFDIANQGGLGAVVNVVTKAPAAGFSLKPSFAAGSFGFLNPSIVGSAGNRTFRLLGGYSYRTPDPYKDGSGRPFTDYVRYSDAGKNQNAFDIQTGWVDTEISLSDRQVIALSYSRQESGLILYPYLSMDSDYDNADRVGAKYTLRDLPGTLRAVRISTYLTQVKHFMSDSQRATASNGNWKMGSDARSKAIGGRIETDLGRDLTAGGESYYRNWNVLGYMRPGMATTTNPTIPDVDTQTAGAFLDYRHSLTERVRVSGGVRFDHASMRVTSPNPNTNLYYQFHGTRRTTNMDNYPSGNLRFNVGLPWSIQWFAGAGTTGRTPDAAERYISRPMAATPMSGNPLLPVTRNNEVTTGLNLNNRQVYLRPLFFYSFLNDYILVNNQPRLNAPGMGMAPGGMPGMPSPVARSYTGVDARMWGGEASYGFVFSEWLSVSGGTSYTRGTAKVKPAAGVNGSNLPEIPPLKSGASLRYLRRWMFAEFGAVAAGRQSLVSADLQETPTPGYALLNFKLGFTHRGLAASFTVDNLLDRYYYEHLSYYRDPFSAGIKVPEPGRNFFVQIRYSF
jgi:iron complex outermembrane receptor protein